MKKIKELFKAFAQLPKLFGLVFRTDKKYLVYMICETICFALLPYPTMFLAKYSLDALEKKISYTEFAVVCTSLILLQFFVSMLKSLFNSIRPGRTSYVVGILNNDFHRKSMEIDYELLAEKKTQELQAYAGDFIKWKLNNTVWNFISLFSSLISFSISCVILLNINAYIIGIIAVVMCLDALFAMAFSKPQFKINKKIIQNDRYINYYNDISVSENAAKDIRIFDMSDGIQEKAESYYKSNLKLEKKKRFFANIQELFNYLISHSMDFAVYVLLGAYVLKSELSLGEMSLAVSNIVTFRQYFKKVSSTLVGYSDTAKYVEYYNSFMSLESKFRKTGQENFILNKTDKFTIEFKNVSFRYPGQEEYVLHDFNIKINSNEKISIIGENGAGKSTFIKLLMRLYDPINGEILFNGTNIKNFDYDQYLSIFTPVFQDFKLFAFTLKENISSFKCDDSDKVIDAANKAGIAKYIENLPDEYNTFISKRFCESGVDFSGGEQQKIAIARAYYKNNSLITILDEPTSALDPKAEYRIYKEFNDLIGDNTAFFISHRLASSKFCDKIMVIKDKKLFEYGTHKELMAKDGYYSELYNMQSSYYE